MTIFVSRRTGQATPQLAAEQAARDRVGRIAALFGNIEELILEQIDKAQREEPVRTKALLSQIADLQHAHLLLLKAEEAFHDKFGLDDTEPAEEVNASAMRAAIDRKIARLGLAGDAADAAGESDSGGS